VLVLFDIDCTLLHADGAGMASLVEAGQVLYGRGFTADGVEFAGRLDPLIVRDLLATNSQRVELEAERAMRREYHAALSRRLAEAGSARALPGAVALLEELRRASGVTVGLLTGNFPETGAIKLRAAGFDPEVFEVAAWGDSSPHDPPAREHLAPVAIEAHARLKGARLGVEQVIVIGDTPHDVACARASGCRALAVATGRYTCADLAAADLAVEDLATSGNLCLGYFKGCDAGRGREAEVDAGGAGEAIRAEAAAPSGRGTGPLTSEQVSGTGATPDQFRPAGDDRFEALDVLRGVAVLGILAMNIAMFAMPLGAYWNPTIHEPFEGANRIAYIVTHTIFDLKMMAMFSMLFGAGVILYARKAVSPGRRGGFAGCGCGGWGGCCCWG
jgi:phosphoglycolate phosphatase